jgi:uncharacterized membrane-anchored protein
MSAAVRVTPPETQSVFSVSSGHVVQADPVGRTRSTSSKVPAVTRSFWIVTILSTTVGESMADVLHGKLGLGLAATALLVLAVLGATLVVQTSLRSYVPGMYWLTVALMSIVAASVTGLLTDDLEIPLPATVSFFGLALLAVLLIWYLIDYDLSVGNITTPRREAFYWLAVAVTSALGTAAGELVAEATGFGSLVSALVFIAAMCLVGAVHDVVESSRVLTFWIAYVLTRPLGASLGDLLSGDRGVGGPQLGAMATSVIVAIVVGALVAYSPTRRPDRNYANGFDTCAKGFDA